MFRSFTVGACKCYSNEVRDKLLTIIEAGCGTLDDFDALVRAIDIDTHFRAAANFEARAEGALRISSVFT